MTEEQPIRVSPAMRRTFQVEVYDPQGPPPERAPGRLRRKFSVPGRTASEARDSAFNQVNDDAATAQIATRSGGEVIVITLSKAAR